MSNSELISYTNLSPNCTSPRKNKITKITPHHMAANLSIEACSNYFANPSRQASANYLIGSDGRICLCVDENNRAWTTGDADNDNRAITIEVANDLPSDAGGWHVSDKAMAALVTLMTDICKRNNIKQLDFTGDKNGNVTFHNMFQATLCPGPYIEKKISIIINEVNARLSGREYNMKDAAKLMRYLAGWKYENMWIYDVNGDGKINSRDLALMLRKIAKNDYNQEDQGSPETFNVGDKVRIRSSVNMYTDGTTIARWVKNTDLYIRSIDKGIVLLSTEKEKKNYTGSVYENDIYKI